MENEELTSMNEEVDIDELNAEDLEDVAGGLAFKDDCTGCNGIYTPA